MQKLLTRVILACLIVGACKCPIRDGNKDAGIDETDGGPVCIGDQCEHPKCPGEFRFVWPVSDTAVLAAVPSPTDITNQTGELYFVTSGCVATKLDDKVFMGTVQVNLNSPPSAVYVADGSVDEAKGKINFLDLTASPPHAVEIPLPGLFGGSNVYYGATGKQILAHIPAPLGQPAKTQLSWSNGSTPPTTIAASATLVVFNPDRTRAVVADNANGGKGDLISVDMATGAHAKVTSGTILDTNNQPLFTVAGNTLAFVDNDGALKTLSLADSTSVKTIDSSAATPKVAGLSADGSKIAFLTGTDVKFGAADGTDTPVTIGAVNQLDNSTNPPTIRPPIRPVVSPDGKAVLYFSNVVNKFGFLGTAFLTGTTAGATPLKLGDNAPVAQFTFGSCGFNVSAITGMQDASKVGTVRGVGNVTRTTPGTGCALTGTTATNLLPGPFPAATGNGVHASDFLPFRSHGVVAFIGGYKTLGEMQLGKGYVASMGAGMATEASGTALRGTLEASQSTEKVLYIGDATVGTDGSAVGNLVIGFSDGNTSSILSNVVEAHFTPDGHAVAVTSKDGTNVIHFSVGVP